MLAKLDIVYDDGWSLDKWFGFNLPHPEMKKTGVCKLRILRFQTLINSIFLPILYTNDKGEISMVSVKTNRYMTDFVGNCIIVKKSSNQAYSRSF